MCCWLIRSKHAHIAVHVLCNCFRTKSLTYITEIQDYQEVGWKFFNTMLFLEVPKRSRSRVYDCPSMMSVVDHIMDVWSREYTCATKVLKYLRGKEN